jgi:RHS repeat-associated protein
VHDTTNRLLEDSKFRFAYDANGNLTSKQDKSTSALTTYDWDVEDRLVAVHTPTQTVTFRYDPLGRRIEKAGSTITRYLYDQEDIIDELDGMNALITCYTHGPGIDEPLARRDATTNTVTYHAADGLGSITDTTNSSGQVSLAHRYDSYGNVLAGGGTGGYAFTGREWAPEAGLLYLRARYYDPMTGRFVSEDPSDQESSYDDPNPYTYVENNPINWVDLLGLYTLKRGEKHPPLPPSQEIDKLLKCIEAKTGLTLVVTSTSEDIAEHPRGTPHRRGVAVDLRYNPGSVDKILCAAAGCGARFALDEAKHPSSKSTHDHLHLQIPLGINGGHGDLPMNGCGCSQ